MLARLEILSCQREKQSYWILRPAIEEFETYTRPSFCSLGLEQRLRESIFSKKDDAGGWIPLGSGAACRVDEPERLLRAVDGAISDWMRNSQHMVTANITPESKASVSGVGKPQQQQHYKGVSIQASKGVVNGEKPAQPHSASVSAKKPTQAQKDQDVITID